MNQCVAIANSIFLELKLFPQAKSSGLSSRRNLMQAGRPMADAISAGMGAAGFPQRLDGNAFSSHTFRLRVVRSGGVVHRLGTVRPLAPVRVAGSAEATARPFPTKDAASFRDSRKNKKTAFAATRLPRKRSHDPDIHAGWSLSRAPHRPAATATEERRALPQSSCPLLALERSRRRSYRDRGAGIAGFDQTETLRAVAVPSIAPWDAR